VGLLDVIKRMRPRATGALGETLPDPALPPGNRGDWDAAALTNVEITELVKSQIRTHTKPWQK
jgi:hypothetical protein